LLCLVNKNIISRLSLNAILYQKLETTFDETTLDFIVPLQWKNGFESFLNFQLHLRDLETLIDNEVYTCYLPSTVAPISPSVPYPRQMKPSSMSWSAQRNNLPMWMRTADGMSSPAQGRKSPAKPGSARWHRRL
jgi:hypothetical protein